MNENLIILAAGASSRMKKQTSVNSSLTQEEIDQADKRTKALISIDESGRPMLDYILLNAQKAGYKNVYLVTQKENRLFKEMYEDEDRFRGMHIQFAIQFISKGREKPFGTADAVFQTLEQYPELKKRSFTVCNSDNLYSINAFRLLRANAIAPNALISYDRATLNFSEERISQFALLRFTPDGFLKEIIEKPSIDQLKGYKDPSGKVRVSMNIFQFDGNMFFNYLKKCPIHPVRNEKELPTALMNMIKDYPRSTIGIPVAEHVPDLTSKEDIRILKAYIKQLNNELK